MADGGAASLTQDPAARIRVSDEVLESFPTFRLRVLYAFGIRNRPSDATSRAWLREGASRGLAALGDMRPGEHPHVKLWRDAYSAFGAKPSAYPCSAEALIQRVVKGGADAVPGINCLVDAYNAVSLAHLLPIGGGPARRSLRAAVGDEQRRRRGRRNRSRRAQARRGDLGRRRRLDVSPLELATRAPYARLSNATDGRDR